MCTVWPCVYLSTQAITPLKHYLSVNVNNLNIKLLYNVFTLYVCDKLWPIRFWGHSFEVPRLLQKIWALTISTISLCTSRLQKQAPDRHVHTLLYGTLLTLKDFLFARGEGLTGACLETDEYKVGEKSFFPLMFSVIVWLYLFLGTSWRTRHKSLVHRGPNS